MRAVFGWLGHKERVKPVDTILFNNQDSRHQSLCSRGREVGRASQKELAQTTPGLGSHQREAEAIMAH